MGAFRWTRTQSEDWRQDASAAPGGLVSWGW